MTNKNPEKLELLQDGIEKWLAENEDAAKMLVDLELLDTDKKNKKSNLSLRKLEYLCKTFASDKKVVFSDDNGNLVDLMWEYDQVKLAHQKSFVDAFRRTDRYPFNINGTEVITTLGQLNFFRFLFEKGAMEFALERVSEIGEEMKEASNKKRKAEPVEHRKGKKAKQQLPSIVIRQKTTITL